MYIYTHIYAQDAVYNPIADDGHEGRGIRARSKIQEQPLEKENAISRVSGRWEGGAEPLTSGVVSIRSWGTERDERHRCAGRF